MTPGDAYTSDATAQISTVAELAALLRRLRRRHARQWRDRQLSLRELATKTGWSHGIIGAYLAGEVLPPPDRFDVLIRLLGATAGELGVLATVRDRVEDERRLTADPARRAGVIPRQLPAEPFGFVGRTGPLAQLDQLVAGRHASRAVAISAISGLPGIGKSTLAVHWAHRVADQFPDGQLYLNLRGFDPVGTPMTVDEAIRCLLDALGVPAYRMPDTRDARSGLYRSLLADRQALVVLDNAATIAQVRPLLPGGRGCMAVVTSRDTLSGLVAVEGAQAVNLDLLTADEARQLLVHRLGPARVAAEPAAADQVIRYSARLPLALGILAARAATRPRLPLASLADELRREGGGLDALAGGDPTSDVRAVLGWSYHGLSAAASRLFQLLGRHHGPDIGAAAAASLAGVPAHGVHPLLDELTRSSMIIERSPGRYVLHDLLRAYATDCAPATENDTRSTG